MKFVGGVSTPEIARRIFQAAGLSWPLPQELTDPVLEAKLFADSSTKQGHRRQVEPDWASINRELKRKHVTLSILWDEYIERNPDTSSVIRTAIARPCGLDRRRRATAVLGDVARQTADVTTLIPVIDRTKREACSGHTSGAHCLIENVTEDPVPMTGVASPIGPVVRMARRISMGARWLVWAVTERYGAAGRHEQGRILDELTATTGWHRKHALGALYQLALPTTHV